MNSADNADTKSKIIFRSSNELNAGTEIINLL